MSEDALPPDTKLTTTKQRWAEEGRFLTGRIARPDAERLPPGQHLVRDWPVLDLGLQPVVTRESFRLDVTGAVENALSLDWAAFSALPQSRSLSDIHCVTTWSRYDNTWEGVLTRDLLDVARPAPHAAAVMLHSYDGYTTNLLLADFASEDALIAHSWEGRPLTQEHGAPARLVVPHLYFWKSAKWIKAIEFIARDKAGFWEERGYHMRGDPWGEQRYSDD
ncbi:DMSO/TMAO reductase YedYZ molybdopterin-dependent catalytic subunit [Xanthobacter flavus]|uniref:DMSO/TMAO reductase YedYZ molybdopterin-dependent catalytic subunit n=1 Tax=Xanthobacter flavus TaxID=281 RepID=A0A9W6CER6_XANFL|nr:sulfite oxidase-like oxidoreductase [Xanthobacter flavus]MDR6332708.1 DMSO/TMAO reductase YedYZ molybdopterin-dependent catalytic subunit [Xanthobacter flavus]GLI20983.1 sulfite oxidase-like oxidoreductase [Xanthobacter flavus]